MLEKKFEDARILIEEYNKALGKTVIVYDSFAYHLKMLGAITEDDLKKLSYEEIVSCLMPSGQLEVSPQVLAKKIATIFRGKEETETNYVSAKKADKMSYDELVAAYDWENPDNPVGKRLKSISTEPFIVFENSNKVDVITSSMLLRELSKGFPPREFVTINGVPKKVYSIGESPENYFDENPFYKGRALRPDGTCDQTGRSWEGVALKVRQLIRIAVDGGWLKATIDNVHNILDNVLSNDAPEEFLAKRFPQAYLKFQDDERLGTLPKLIIAAKSKSNSPLGQAKKVNW